MGKHKDKRKKHKKDKKHKKKSRKSSSSEDEWVEKPNPLDSSSEEEKIQKRRKKRSFSNSSSEDDRKHRRKHKKRSSSSDSSSEEDAPKKRGKYKKRSSSTSSSEDERKKYKKPSSEEDDRKWRRNEETKHSKSLDDKEDAKPNTNNERDAWMDLPTSFLSVSNEDRRRNREEAKKLERERQQYNPQECARELNPYWKDGGDGLPKFKKPTDDASLDKPRSSYSSKHSSSWRKKPTSETSDSAQKTGSKWRKPREDRSPEDRRYEEVSDSSRKAVAKKPKEDHSPEDRRYEEKSDIVYTNEEEPVKDEDAPISEKELNMLASKLVKAEIMGNTQLVEELKLKLEKARASRATMKDNSEEVLLTHTDSQGRTQPVRLQSDYGESSHNRKKKKAIETHQDGQRVRYFADDDKYSLKQMFENEKYNTVEDQNSEFIKMANKVRKNDDLDDVFSDNIRKKESDAKIDARNRDRAITEHKKVAKSLDNCNRCIQSDLMLKHLMVSLGETVYLSLPQIEPLTEGHSLIVPVRHVPCSTQLDENEWAEMLDFRRALVRYFASQDQDVVFFETAMSLFKFPHMAIQCIPLPREEGDMAPIYFKKAIDESETEWAQNKKLVNLKGRDVRKAIPKGLPYFFVSFGMDEGFAHVIEDEQAFPQNFAQEIIGGMLDLHHSKWRKPKRQTFDEQSKRVLEFSKTWHKYDCTVK